MIVLYATVELSKKEKVALRAKEDSNMQLLNLMDGFNWIKVTKKKSYQQVKVKKLKTKEVVQFGFNKAIKSFKLKVEVEAKDRFNSYY